MKSNGARIFTFEGMCSEMFKKFIDEMIKANTVEEIEDILYRKDGVDLSFQHDKISWVDHQRLFNLASKLEDLMR